ncbi:hypothetical protein OOK29_32810 [Streptomyces phaeochromogenes]|uniref:hypothetical protein n=1 Tax=Streptomyces phaeochromogenes TaxID=1923 RepID=UPI00225735B0|nr:hypothetical protein [Streptomyces phaeochromogenes]MCX5602928.1 hypothetical protein [Streptomyces phaeochromogenes]
MVGALQHAARAAGEPNELVLLDVLDQVCARCAGQLPARLPDAVVALWRACSLTVAADRFVGSLREDTRARTWLGYAIALDRSPRKDDARVRELLRPVLLGDEFGAQAWKAMAGWSQVLERAEEQLAVYREAAPPAVASVTVGAALDAVGREAAVHEQARVLERAVGGGRRSGCGTASACRGRTPASRDDAPSRPRIWPGGRCSSGGGGGADQGRYHPEVLERLREPCTEG